MYNTTEVREILRSKCCENIETLYGLKELAPEFAETLRKMVEERLDYEIKEICAYNMSNHFLAMASATEFIKKSGYILHPARWGTSSIVAYLLGITNIEPISYGLVFSIFSPGGFFYTGEQNLKTKGVNVTLAQSSIEGTLCIKLKKFQSIFLRLPILICSSRKKLPEYLKKQEIEEKKRLLSITNALDLKRHYGELGEYIKCSNGLDARGNITEQSVRLRDFTELNYCEEMRHFNEQILYGGLPPCGKRLKLHDNIIEQSLLIRNFLELRYLSEPLREMIVHLQQMFNRSNFRHFILKSDFQEVVQQHSKEENLEILDILAYGSKAVDNLSIAIEKIKESTPDFDFDSIPLNDEKTYKLISEGRIKGIPYLDSYSGEWLCRQIRPDNFEEHIALLSFICNPLAMGLLKPYLAGKSVPDKIEYEHPEVGMILGETYGTLLYNEQAIHLMKNLAGIPYNAAFICLSEFTEEKENKASMKCFIEGCGTTGISEGIACSLWNKMAKALMFSKSYCVQHAMLAYKMAYIRVNYEDKL